MTAQEFETGVKHTVFENIVRVGDMVEIEGFLWTVTKVQYFAASGYDYQFQPAGYYATVKTDWRSA